MTTEPNTILGLPQHLQCYSQPSYLLRGGAVHPGSDISIVDCSIPDRFLMTLCVFQANGPINGLLMYERNQSTLRVDPSGIPEPRQLSWHFFGYLCERCQRTFLLPYWASSTDDLPRAVRHSCMGGMDIDEVPREGIRQLANETAVQILDQFFLREPMLGNDKDRKRGDYLGSLVDARLENALASFWQEMVTMAVEKAQGRY